MSSRREVHTPAVKELVSVRALVTLWLSVVVLVTGAMGSDGIATAYGAHASIACRAPANGRFPTVSRLRVAHAGCTTARAVAEGIQANWQATGKLHASFDLYADGPAFHCRYRQHRGSPNVYKTARCTSSRKLVTMTLGS